VPANFHYVDGGYYDTFGMVSLIEWLRAALIAHADQPPLSDQEEVSQDMAEQQILIVEINRFRRRARLRLLPDLGLTNWSPRS
jgi:hypothetical protein